MKREIEARRDPSGRHDPSRIHHTSVTDFHPQPAQVREGGMVRRRRDIA